MADKMLFTSVNTVITTISDTSILPEGFLGKVVKDALFYMYDRGWALISNAQISASCVEWHMQRIKSEE